MAEGFYLPDQSIGGTRIGKIFVSNTVIGMGSGGSRVFEGLYDDGTPVAVKRVVHDQFNLAYWCPQLIHPNIVRYWAAEYDEDFMYFPLERCTCSLYDLILALSAPSDSSDLSVSPDDSPSMVMYKSKLRYVRDTMQDVKLWMVGGRPSPLLLKLMREVVSGLGYLHGLEILHQDIKPQNILITGKPLVAKLSDMGSYTSNGTPGWQAREVLLPGCFPTPAIDMFSFGCVLFFCVTGGKHPFGRLRESNILNNAMDLSSVSSIPEAHDLISDLLNPDPILRPKASEVLQHPFLMNSETRLSFFSGFRDRAVAIAHSMDAPKLAKEIGRFPALLMESCKVVSRFCKKDVLRKHLKLFK
ncbi:serine/threonine-protein kinase/endoribonuclease IRE1a-like isoform X1 [Rhodamnia argentea]|uniref:Serine/threonine-protein kinase/endoribonuclease IRE1a-like isoform X1 n=1 Tax=Rhodamnia argentea TaxID=178133 RepID=A0A8B8P8P6_9MYRT|nr:serine/threonine-protein kinase/endoribonuclease IRE1a-like isoform X1 [Rhodamnia argentea]